MQKLSIRKLSVLGLVLLAASAVTAAILPTNTAVTDYDGVLEPSTNPNEPGQLTCVDKAGIKNCFLTASATTGGIGTSANVQSSAGLHSSKSPV